MTIDAAGIKDFSGNHGVGQQWVEWTVDTVHPRILSWASAGIHLRGVGEAALVIPDDNTFSEPRDAGVRRLLVTFSEAIHPASFTPAAVRIAGNGSNANPRDLSGIVITTSTRSDGMVGVIEFSTALPDYARYLVRIEGVTDLAGNTL